MKVGRWKGGWEVDIKYWVSKQFLIHINTFQYEYEYCRVGFENDPFFSI